MEPDTSGLTHKRRYRSVFLGFLVVGMIVIVCISLWTESNYLRHSSSVVKRDRADLVAAAFANDTLHELPYNEIEFVATEDLNSNGHIDVFSAAWWQALPRFLQLDTETIKTVEDDAFSPILRTGGGKSDARMPKDWLDFSVEHLSRWWRTMGGDGMTYTLGKLQSYVQHAISAERRSDLMASTLAIIPYGVTTEEPREKHLWSISLAATIVSLLRHGVGRVVVVGYYKADAELTEQAFRLLSRYRHDVPGKVEKNRIDGSFFMNLGTTEFAFVHTTDVVSTFIPVNVPKGALKGLQQAFRNQTLNATSDIWQPWIGKSKNKWKYIYMTEADQILHARISHFFEDVMDDGRIIVPHRLQPVPHPLDVDGVVDPRNVLPKKLFPQVYELDYLDSCCDTMNNPGMSNFTSCGNNWWRCGFNGKHEHERLESYSFLRLTDGTGVVNVAATAHSRQCMPIDRLQGGCKGAQKKRQ